MREYSAVIYKELQLFNPLFFIIKITVKSNHTNVHVCIATPLRNILANAFYTLNSRIYGLNLFHS